MKLALRKVTWIVILVMIGLLGLTAAAMASDIDWPWSSETGVEPQALTQPDKLGNYADEGQPGAEQPAVQQVIGAPSAEGDMVQTEVQAKLAEPQPDDNGYAGPIPETIEVDLVPSGEQEVEAINWDAMVPESAPDARTPDQAGADVDPNWTGYYYFRAAGSALRPRDSSVNWGNSSSGGCLYLSSGATATVFNIHLDIPNGARIDYLRIYYYDTSTSNSQAWVTRYNDEGSLADVSGVTSLGPAGSGTNLSDLASHVVDSVNYSYVLNWRPNQLGSTMMLCGLRVAYMLP